MSIISKCPEFMYDNKETVNVKNVLDIFIYGYLKHVSSASLQGHIWNFLCARGFRANCIILQPHIGMLKMYL